MQRESTYFEGYIDRGLSSDSWPIDGGQASGLQIKFSESCEILL